MMNSTVNDDEFGDNPFRSSSGGGDVFFDVPPVTADPLNQQQQMAPPQQQQQFGQPTGGFQQQQPPPLQQYPPQQQPQYAPQQPMQSSFPPPSGPMDNMAKQQPQQAPMQPVQPTSWWSNLMMCMTMDTYRTYFDIDADDIYNRMKGVFIHFYKPEHFRSNVVGAQRTGDLKGPDLYGPFWLTMTLIFFLGVTSNVHDYFHRSDVEEFDYDIKHLLHASTVLLVFSLILPSVIWITTQFMNMQALLLVDWVCIYGYSLVPYLPAVLFCFLPGAFFSWIFLLAATIVSGSLIIRNVAPPLLSSDVGRAKAPPLILAIMGFHFIFFLYLKFSFYHHRAKK